MPVQLLQLPHPTGIKRRLSLSLILAGQRNDVGQTYGYKFADQGVFIRGQHLSELTDT